MTHAVHLGSDIGATAQVGDKTEVSKEYDRVSGYFSVDSLFFVAAGLTGLIRNKGYVRLVLGVNDIGPEQR